MPVATHVLTGDFSGLVGEVSQIRATVSTNSADGGWVNDVDNVIVLGSTVLAVGADGKFTVTLPTSTGTGLQYQVSASFTDGGRIVKTWDSGWFSLTTNADLADKANNSTLRVNTTLGDQLAARIDGYTDHGDVSGTLAVDPATGTHVLNATGALLVTLGEEVNGTIVTLYIVGGAENVTVDGIADLELTDGAFASFVRIRGAWVLASSGAAAGPSDTTPPPAVTTLAVTPGSDGVTATATFTPVTDAESPVKYRYRVYTTGSTAPAWPTSGAQYNLAGSPIALTGLTTGTNYTMEIQAYSAGGSATADSATFATPTPAGWNVWDSIDFADQTAGTFASPKDFTTDQGRTLQATSGNQIIVGTGKIKGEYQQSPVSLTFPTATPPTQSRVIVPFELIGFNGSYPPTIEFSMSMNTGNARVFVDLYDLGVGIPHRLRISPNYGSGATYTAGAGYELATDGVNGIPSSGTLRIESDGQVLSAYIDDDFVLSADFTAHTFAGGPNALVGAFTSANTKNDAAIYGITWEAYS